MTPNTEEPIGVFVARKDTSPKIDLSKYHIDPNTIGYPGNNEEASTYFRNVAKRYGKRELSESDVRHIAAARMKRARRAANLKARRIDSELAS